MTKEEFLQNAEACIREYGGNANVEEILLRKFIKESGREKARLYKERMEKYQPSYCAHWDFFGESVSCWSNRSVQVQSVCSEIIASRSL
ncbi:MAG: hypothetical protein IJK62_00315 [Bacteroidales bacterium]|nr:hypothetical protein [Bacteroidales bacterium]